MRFKSILLTLIALFNACFLVAKDRPKIAVVLAGGGAKGVAHISALKTIEDAGIPIDIVVGTSMGSIIGGMYCVGYSPDSMRTIVGSNDWVKLIMDNPDYGNSHVSARMDDENYIFRMAIDAQDRSQSGGKAGVISGRNVMKFFRSLTKHIPDSIDFSELPTQFACVATNAYNGEKKVFTQGSLPRSIRASMAIPTVFTPMHINGSSYIDGGLADNFPIDVARSLGADIVIGVNLVIPTTEEKLTNSAVDILMNVFDMNSRELLAKNIKDADIYIPIDVTGYSAASFTPAAMDTLMARGAYYSQLKKDELLALHDRLQLDEPVHRIRIGEYSFAQDNTENSDKNPSLKKLKENYNSSSINLGARFDNDEYASINVNGRFLVNHKHSTVLDANIRLGQRIGAGLDLSTKTIGSQRVAFFYQYMHRDMAYYETGNKIGQISSSWHNLGIYATQDFKNVQYSFGLDYDRHRYHSILGIGTDIDDDTRSNNNESYFTYYIDAEYNSLNRQYFSTKGQQLYVLFDLVSSNLVKYHDNYMIPIVTGFWQKAISAGSRFTFRPHASIRYMFPQHDDDLPFSKLNIIGGFHRAMQCEQQMTMAGLSHMEIISDLYANVAGLTLQERLFKNHFACLRFDAASVCSNFNNLLDDGSLYFGWQGSYSIRTAIGPITVAAGYNTLSDSFDMSFNAGYCF